MTALLELAFFLSGVAAVAFETLWFYQAGLGLGNSIWASSIVLAAFMGGLGIGNGWVARHGDRLRDPLRLYAALANLAAGSLALLVANRLAKPAASAQRPQRDALPSVGMPRRAGALLVAAFLSGAALLALEVIWFRFLLLVVSGTSTTFAVLLAVVLAGIGLGGLAASGWLARSTAARFWLPAVAAAAGVLCTAVYVTFGSLPRSFEGRSALSWIEILEVSVPLMFPVSFLSGVLFTLIGEALHREWPGETRAAGFLTLANTFGAMAGSLAAGFVLLPDLGVNASIRLISAAYGGIALVLGVGAARLELAGRARTLANFAMGCALLAAVVLSPGDLMRTRYVAYPIQRFLPEWKPIEVREGLTETIIYLRDDALSEPLAYRLLTNSHSMSSTVTRDARYMKLFVYWPVAVHPAPKSALLIGYVGSGSPPRRCTTRTRSRRSTSSIRRGTSSR